MLEELFDAVKSMRKPTKVLTFKAALAWGTINENMTEKTQLELMFLRHMGLFDLVKYVAIDGSREDWEYYFNADDITPERLRFLQMIAAPVVYAGNMADFEECSAKEGKRLNEWLAEYREKFKDAPFITVEQGNVRGVKSIASGHYKIYTHSNILEVKAADWQNVSDE